MEYLTNTCEYNEAYLTEALRVQTRLVQGKKNIILLVLITGVLLFSLWAWLIDKQTRFALFAGLCVLMYGMMWYIRSVQPKKTAKLQADRIRKEYGSLTYRSEFREEEIAMFSPSEEEISQVSYEKLSKLVETEHLLLLLTKTRHMLLLDKRGFAGGGEAELRALLMERAPQALSAK